MKKKSFNGTNSSDDEEFESEDGTEETELYHQLQLSVVNRTPINRAHGETINYESFSKFGWAKLLCKFHVPAF